MHRSTYQLVGAFIMLYRRDSDGMKKAKAYGTEEAGWQSGKKKIEYEVGQY